MGIDNTQLPAEVVEEIQKMANELYPLIGDVKKKIGFKAGATEYATKLHQAEQEIKELKQWKIEAIAVLDPILEYGRSKEAGIPLGKSITKTVLERCKQVDGARALLEKVVEKYGQLYEWRSGIINEIKAFLDGTK
jgi:hypothetical protein